jgi:pimeloyl-ACP methyl ester carboxylesterase
MRTMHTGRGGPQGRQTIICLHSSGGSGAQWKAFAQLAPEGVAVLTPDLYGHGAGPAWPGPPDDIVGADAARIARLAADAGGDVHLVGHSYGATIALRVAMRNPGTVRSVAAYEPIPMRVLFDHAPDHPAVAEMAVVAAVMRRALECGDAERSARSFVDYWSGAPQWMQLAPEQRVAVARRMPTVCSHFVSLRHDGAGLRDYARIDVPVLYLKGANTRAPAQKVAELLEHALPFVEMHTLEGMGHLGPISHAQPVAQAIARFVGRQVAAWTAPELEAA